MRHFDAAAVEGVEGVQLQQLDKRDRMWWHYPGLRKLNWLLMGCIVCDVTNGYDGSMLNGLQITNQWQEFFHHPKGTSLGTLSNGTRYGQLVALLVIAPLLERFGRRKPIIFGSCILLLGVALQTAAQSYGMFLAGRLLIGFGNAIQSIASPVLVSELAYPFQRTQMVGILNTTGSFGQIMAAWITFGTAFMAGSWAWRLPSLLQALSSLFQVVMCIFVPESPRWLVAQNRRDEAWEILKKYHAEGDADSQLLQYEMQEIDSTIEAQNAQTRSSWLSWFASPANRHRLFIVVTLGFIIQWCGNAIISYYIHLVFNSIGITSTKKQLLISGGATISGFVWGNVWSLNVDRWGRRPMYLIGMAGMFLSFLMITVFTGVNQGINFKNTGLGNATIFAIFLFGFFYKMPGCMIPSYIAEVAPFELRAKAFVLNSFGDAAANIFSGYINPIGLVAIKWKYYIIWCCVLVSNFLIGYFFFPETKNLSLEEVTLLFDNTNDTVTDKMVEAKHEADGAATHKE